RQRPTGRRGASIRYRTRRSSSRCRERSRNPWIIRDSRICATTCGGAIFEASRHVYRYLMGQTNPPFMSGVPELLVLRLLARKEMYGYELVKAIRTATSEAIGLGEGVVYPSLYGLERKGALKARRKTVNGRSR